MSTFLTRLERACESNRSLVCVGLDVDPGKMPVADTFEFNRAIVDATADLVCAYKPNLAFFEALGIPGLEALQRTVEYIHSVAPQVIVIGDAKRGDIGPSGQAYARAMFRVWGFDAVTVNAWGGQDTIAPFLEDPDRGVFIWCRGSNPGSADLQDLTVDAPQGRVPLYQHLAQASLSWNGAGNLGLVVGATNPDQLQTVRGICPGMPLLIPGIGAQGGELAAAVRMGTDHRGRLAIVSSSRGIIYASGGPDYAEAARREASRLREAINRILDAEGKGWPSS
ncbi:MAG: orotidine-5'-phosphate decarboxylase [Dehalococcoidia bacterium]|jgi:orotidine-5'-phosphate decarboxylase|nr:orotidine-5'-phosphate decarboxylase [Dehalococcoidia bacterium]MDP7085555.1 orotidine-5'-phosphate decarboxylase [Dehalococcoidia bacterium]MDP7202320.1 orotidine-5'-phosphate decarboxylase [Dehalococcoidia bacterium]MDP7511731.1 orotidine-5'-phosphate decarboxylase [Dehalococcoidia bacterium]HJN85537.1 orotidine-5'-phosphate decarboxylase [Dehalococcoidia bacterium]